MEQVNSGICKIGLLVKFALNISVLAPEVSNKNQFLIFVEGNLAYLPKLA